MIERTEHQNEALRNIGMSQEQWEAIKLIFEAVKNLSVRDAQGAIRFSENALPWLSETPSELDQENLLALINRGVEFT
ncbi:hypothetical protein JCM14076_30210 [Methylosoma difficile]